MSLDARHTCFVCDGFVDVPAGYKGSGRCRCDEIRARDLGTGPTRRFGSALPPSVDKRIPRIPLVTVKPIRPRAVGPCPGCGSRYFGCDCEEANG